MTLRYIFSNPADLWSILRYMLFILNGEWWLLLNHNPTRKESVKQQGMGDKDIWTLASIKASPKPGPSRYGWSSESNTNVPITTLRITSTAWCSQQRCGYTSTRLYSTNKCGCSAAKLFCSMMCLCVCVCVCVVAIMIRQHWCLLIILIKPMDTVTKNIHCTVCMTDLLDNLMILLQSPSDQILSKKMGEYQHIWPQSDPCIYM